MADADGRVSNLAFSANLFGFLPDVYYTYMGYTTSLFPDSLAFRYVRDLGTAGNTGKRSMFASAGFIFDPYSLSFDEFYQKGLFENNSGVQYGYRLDTLWTYIDYRLQNYNSASPDTLRFDITYFDPYTYFDTSEYIVTNINFGSATPYVLCPKFEYPNPIPQKGIGPLVKSSQRTIDYILKTTDSIISITPAIIY
jgi:hypothetical protein